MYDAAVSRISPFAHLWPWPGNIFLFLFGGWALYMGMIADVADVKVAFFGLFGTTSLLFLFGLRTIGRRPMERKFALDIPTAVEEVRERSDVALEEPDSRDRTVSTIPTHGDIESEPGFPMNTRPRERERERSDTIHLAGEGASNVLEEEVRSVTSMLMRERAERGAALAKVDSEARAAIAEMRAEIIALRQEWMDARPALTAVADGDQQGAAPASTAPDLTGYLMKDEFNRAINQRLLPTIEERIGQRIQDAVDIDALRASLASEAGEVDRDALSSLRAELSQAREIAEKALRRAAELRIGDDDNDAGLAGREDVAAMVRSDQARLFSLDAALRALLMPADGEDGGASEPAEQAARLRSRFDDVAQRLDKADASIATLGARVAATLGEVTNGGGDGEAVMTHAELSDTVVRVSRRLEGLSQTSEAIDETKRTLDDVMSHVSRMGEHYQDLSRRVEELGAAPPPIAPEPGPRNEVAELRDALSILINESREIRAQRERESRTDEGSPSDAF